MSVCDEEHSVLIEQVHNGYLLSLGEPFHYRETFPDLEAVFRRLLSYFEGRWPEATPEQYGAVTISRTKPRE
jgi:hypothetical protein